VAQERLSAIPDEVRGCHCAALSHPKALSEPRLIQRPVEASADPAQEENGTRSQVSTCGPRPFTVTLK
jgi:hypothetical protein